MVLLRSLLFNVAFYTVTTLACLTLIWAPAFGRRTALAVARVYLKLVHAMERGIIGLRYRVVGREHLPDGPFVLAAKHQSAWETMKFHLLFDAPAVVLKQELLRIPVWGWYARVTGNIGIDRAGGSRALAGLLDQARTAAAEGRPIVIFPQGTRTAPGTWRGYKYGVTALYLELGLPVVPMALNSGLFWGRRTFLKRPGTITVEFLEPIRPGLSRAEFQATLVAHLEAASNRLSLAEGGPVADWPHAAQASHGGQAPEGASDRNGAA